MTKPFSSPESPTDPILNPPSTAQLPDFRILIADDHGLFAEGLQNLLLAGGYQVVGIAYDGLEALRLARQLNPNLILMDVRMPKCTGLEATKLIKAEMPAVQIVILTTSRKDADIFEALKSGANGYLLKNLKPNVLFNYLSGLSRGEAPISRELSASVLNEFVRQAAQLEGHPGSKSPTEDDTDLDPDDPQNDPTQDADVQLTPRQRQILEMIAEGYLYKEVGAALHISENTVKYHMGEIIQRLHVKNREQVVAYALRSGLLKE